MHRAVALFLGIFICGALAGALASGAGDAGKNFAKVGDKRLLGKWELVERISDGKKVDQKGTWTFFSNQILYGPDAAIHAVYKVDPSKKPMTLDLAHVTESGKIEDKVVGIYEVEGDSLKLCVSIPGKTDERPKTFESKEGSGHTLTVLRRVKAEK
jgi:uncharacterized protein (TIGR03067 family)